MAVRKAQRLQQLPPYLFVEIDRKRKKLEAEGKDVINLGVGDPDRPTPSFIREALVRALERQNVSRYPLDRGLPEFRQAIARYHQRRHGARLDADREIWPLIGSKEGIAHLSLALLDPGDVALVPDPGYPPYRSGTVFAGGTPEVFPLKASHAFLPDLEELQKKLTPKTKLLFSNYPNNPTGTIAPREFLQRLVQFAQQTGVVVCHDVAYSEIWFEERPLSILEIPGAKEVAVEFHSLTKSYNMAGWRIGWVAGNAEAIAALGALKSNLDSGVFSAIQLAAVEALDKGDGFLEEQRSVYRKRRDKFVGGLQSRGWDIGAPPATFYVWTRVPGDGKSVPFCEGVLEKAHVVLTPGVGFGPSGEGYFRASLTVEDDRVEEAVRRLTNLS